MGCLSSKMAHGNGEMQVNEPSEVLKYLESSEEIFTSDSELRVFNESLTASTARAVTELAAATEESPNAFSMYSMKAVIDTLLEGNSEVAKVILREKIDILKDPDLMQLVEEYLENSKRAVDLCASFEKCFQMVKEYQFLLIETLRQFDEASPEDRIAKTEHNLRRLKDVGDPFTNEFFGIFQSVYQQQISMLKKLTKRRKALEKKLKSTKTWRNVSAVVFVATFISVLVLSVVAAAVSAPPVYAALAGALTVPIGSIGKWCSSLWSKYMKQVKNELKLAKMMRHMTEFRVKELESIENQVKRLELTMETMGHVAGAHLSEDESLRIAVDELSKKIDFVTRIVEDLVTRATHCRQLVKDSTFAVFDEVWKYEEP